MKNKKPYSVISPILTLPSVILSDIFTLLPTKSILSCKSVCKLWYSIIRDRDFPGSSQSYALLVRRSGDNHGFKNLNLVEPKFDYRVRKRAGKLCLVIGNNSVIRFNDRGFDGFDVKMLKVVNSCKGLVCLTVEDWKWSWAPLFVCNPVTSDYIVVKQMSSRDWGCFRPGNVGFGCSSKSGQYKLVRLYRDGGESLMAEVYTLGSDEYWRSVENCPPRGFWPGKGTFFEGSLHWIINQGKMCSIIGAFDCEEEIFRPMNLPDCSFCDKRCTQLGVFQSRLCFSILNIEDLTARKDCDIWVMDEYGVKESWRKLFVVSLEDMFDFNMPLKPLAYLKNGEILMLSSEGELLSYDVESNSWRDVKVPGVSPELEAMLFDPSFLPIQSLLKIGDVSE